MFTKEVNNEFEKFRHFHISEKPEEEKELIEHFEYVAKKHKWLEKHVVPQMDKITHFNYTNDAENIIKWLFANYSSQIKKLDR